MLKSIRSIENLFFIFSIHTLIIDYFENYKN
jgi:hypothetical protein